MNDYKDALEESVKIADDAWKEIHDVYDEAQRRLQNEIDAMVARFGADNAITSDKANKLLHGDEFNKWRMSLQEYVDKIKDAPGDNSLLLELNTLSMKSRITVKEQLMANINREMIETAQKQVDITKATLVNVYEDSFYRNSFIAQKELGFGFNIAKHDQRAIEKIITYPWSTKVFSKGIWDDIEKMTAMLKKELTVGITNGSSIQKMAKIMKDRFNTGRMEAERLIRTESKHFHIQSQLDSFKNMGYDEVIFHKNGICYKTKKGVKRCDCEILDKTSIAIDKAVAGENVPPIHPNCKCYLTAKRKMNIMDERKGITPLKENVKYQQWKNTYIK